MATISMYGVSYYRIPRLIYCETREDLIKHVGDFVFEGMDKFHGVIGEIDFKVAEIPDKEEWLNATTSRKDDLWKEATGAYGIREVGQMFDDSDSRMLVANYLGGNNLMASRMFDFDMSEEEIRSIVEETVGDQLAYDDNQSGPFLLRIIELVEK